MISKKQLHQALKLILHNGLTETKVRNSKKVVSFLPSDKSEKKGSVAAFRSKEMMINAKGFPISSYEALFENDNKLTHWTPNEFSWLGYTNDGSHHLKGHFERNLMQINTFVIDIDFKDVRERDLNQEKVMQSLLLGYVIMPTLVLKTDKGYQVYYVLDDPAFVSKKGNRYPVIETGKMISTNIKNEIKSQLGQVDVGCNNFGIFRIPREDNVVYFEPTMIFSFATFLNWSKNYYENNKPKLQVIDNKSKSFGRQIDQPWFDWLLHKTTIKPGVGLGRHNTILTLALACYSSSMNQSRCYNLLDQFNSNLKASLAQADLDRCVNDAYSGNYQGASSLYISELISTWATEAEKKNLNKAKSNRSWYKFAKSRAERKYSHKSEWKKDIVKLFNLKTNDKGSVIISTRTIQKELGISSSSLNRVLKELKNSNQLIAKDNGLNKKKEYMTLYGLLRQLKRKKEQYRLMLFNEPKKLLYDEIKTIYKRIQLVTQKNKTTVDADISTFNTG
ncbi:primase C-terminal domain-containing protein (plasmid) [Fructilactobacillus vespulae]|uniref:primase C-terminal domain-containing protein n=1 Tax=Fructilactobacillus vespulae TaxID=1249630 RepID=UPI0039B69AAC